jgi:hypothetical protein
MNEACVPRQIREEIAMPHELSWVSPRGNSEQRSHSANTSQTWLTTEGNSRTLQTLMLGSDVGRGEYGGRKASVISGLFVRSARVEDCSVPP